MPNFRSEFTCQILYTLSVYKLYILSDVYIHYFSLRFTVIYILTVLLIVIMSYYIATMYVSV